MTKRLEDLTDEEKREIAKQYAYGDCMVCPFYHSYWEPCINCTNYYNKK